MMYDVHAMPCMTKRKPKSIQKLLLQYIYDHESNILQMKIPIYKAYAHNDTMQGHKSVR